MGGIERGTRNPNLSMMARIAEALSIPLTILLSFDPQAQDSDADRDLRSGRRKP
ncbi:transcriptional regulator [Bradyrhizobium canariense]|uniref:transcriptional regulator n=1 Tax=Bradyrhizobium canariense TaxID=255045 RepID=UPI001FCCC457|nr:transcriptional regulator [Bradyrhizobium canariense]